MTDMTTAEAAPRRPSWPRSCAPAGSGSAPSDVGLPPGPRRRTPGLRREEVAQLAGVGVTWYTWLEQGRPINASVQVLDAIARTLRLDQAERAHLYRLADVPGTADRRRPCVEVPRRPEVQHILDALAPLPGVAWSTSASTCWPGTTRTRRLFPGLTARPARRPQHPAGRASP